MNASMLSRPTTITQLIIKDILQVGDTAIDATAGNGYDTLLLCQLVGEKGIVHAFDIQQEALDSTEQRLSDNDIPSHVYHLHCTSHSQLDQFSITSPKVIMFNLGYLPGSDKETITKTSDTLVALQKAGDMLATQGVLTVMCYPGHEGGDHEAHNVMETLKQWDGQIWKIAQYHLLNTQKPAPFLICAFKIR